MTRSTCRSKRHLVPLLATAALLALSGCDTDKFQPPPPIALGQSVATLPDLAVAITLYGQDPSYAGPLTYSVSTPPSHGALSGSGRDLTYTPTAGFVGQDGFRFTVSNASGTSSPGTVTVDILPTTGPAVPGGEVLDRIMARSLSGGPIGGAALAVAKNGKLVYARGFGYGDEAGALYQPDSLARSTASYFYPDLEVMRLAEAGELSLDAKLLDILSDFTVPPGADPRLRDITLRHLLQRTSGLACQEGNPAIAPLAVAARLGVASPPSCRQTFQVQLGLPLDFTPGAGNCVAYQHSCLLELVIEKVTGLEAQAALQARLDPVGIHDTRLACTRRADRAPGEVVYLSPTGETGVSIFSSDSGAQVPAAYGGYAQATRGFLLASPVDLVRYMDRIWGLDGAAPALSAPTLTAMWTPTRSPWGTVRGWTYSDTITGFVAEAGTGVKWWGTGAGQPGGWISWAFTRDDGWSVAWQRNSFGSGGLDPTSTEIFEALGAGFTGSATDLYPSYPSPSLAPSTCL